MRPEDIREFSRMPSLGTYLSKLFPLFDEFHFGRTFVKYNVDKHRMSSKEFADKYGLTVNYDNDIFTFRRTK